MRTENQHSDQAAQITLAGELTVYSVAEVKARLAEAMNRHDEIEVDLAGITEIDTAGLQLMLIAKRRAGKAVRFVHHSPTVMRWIDLANLGGVLGDLMLVDAADR